MNTTNIARALPANAFPCAQSSTQERLTPHVNSEILCARALIAITLGMAMFFLYVCYHALQSYRVM